MMNACFGALLRSFGQLLYFLLIATMFIGSWEESAPLTRISSSASEQQLQQHSHTTVMPLQLQYATKETEQSNRRRRSVDATADSALPSKILTASHLPALRDLVSQKKITVRLGLRVSLTGPSDLLDPQRLLSQYKKPGIYNLGEKAGLFSMRVLGIKRVTSRTRDFITHGSLS